MIRAVIIRTVGGQHRQAVGMVIRAHQMVGRRLRGRIRAIRRIGGSFGKWRIVWPQRAVHFVGRNMQEAECIPFAAGQARPVAARRFQQAEGTVDIGGDKFCRTVNRTIDMAFGGKVHDRARPVRLQQFRHLGAVTDVGLHEDMAAVVPQTNKIIQIAGIGQLVVIEDWLVALRQPVEHEIRADEAGAACDQYHDLIFDPYMQI